MSDRELPILNFGSFRKYPTKLAHQEYADERQVCGNCLSGSCCTSEDPIYLSSFDVFRLAAFFDLSPAEFLLKFTQDRFEGEDSDLLRRTWIDHPESSKVTYLRRRGNIPTSPCIFLKYICEPDGTPRRICSVHDARPLSCREFYFHHCKTRITGELAALLAEGYEMVRDGEITEEMVDERLAQFGEHDYSSARAANSLEYQFWVELKRVVNLEEANTEGAKSYRAADYQDPIDDKLNRVLSTKYLRFEESYGSKPNNEQLIPYTTGLGFVASPERQRIMKMLCERPSSGLYNLREYPFRIGLRTMVPGVKRAEMFSTIPDDEAGLFLSTLSQDPLFPDHPLLEVRSITVREVYASVLKGINHLISFSSYLAVMGNMLERKLPGVLEMNLLEMIADFGTRLDSCTAHESYLQPVKQYLASMTIGLLEDSLTSARKPADDFGIHSLLCRLWPALPALSPELRTRFETIAFAIRERLQRDELELYVRSKNPVASRRAQGKRLNAHRSWAEWESQVIDMRYADIGGFQRVNLPAFYRQSVDELEKIPFMKSYCIELYRVTVSLARSMNFDHRIACAGRPDQKAAMRLASYGTRLFEWMNDKWGYDNVDIEVLAGFSASLFNPFTVGESRDQNLGLIVHQVLKRQLPDGSWSTNPLPEDVEEAQENYLHQMYYPTCACLDALSGCLMTFSAPSKRYRDSHST